MKQFSPSQPPRKGGLKKTPSLSLPYRVDPIAIGLEGAKLRTNKIGENKYIRYVYIVPLIIKLLYKP